MRQREYDYAIKQGMTPDRAMEYSLNAFKMPTAQKKVLDDTEKGAIHDWARGYALDILETGKKDPYLNPMGAPGQNLLSDEQKQQRAEQYAQRYAERYSYARAQGWSGPESEEYAGSLEAQWAAQASRWAGAQWHGVKTGFMRLLGTSKPEERAENAWFETDEERRNAEFANYREASWLDKHLGSWAGSTDLAITNVVNSLANPDMVALAAATRGESLLSRGGLEIAGEETEVNTATRALMRLSRATGKAIAGTVPAEDAPGLLKATEKTEGAIKAIKEARVPISVQRTARTIGRLATITFTAQMAEGTAATGEQAREQAKKNNWSLATEYGVEALVNGLMVYGGAHHLDAETKLRADLETKAGEVYPDKKFGKLNDQQQAVVINKLIEDDPDYQKAAAASEKQARKRAIRQQAAIQQAWNPNAVTRAINDLHAERAETARKEQVHKVLDTIKAKVQERTDALRAQEEERQAAAIEGREERRKAAVERREQVLQTAEEIAKGREETFANRQAVGEIPTEAETSRHVEAEEQDGHVTYPVEFWGETNHLVWNRWREASGLPENSTRS